MEIFKEKKLYFINILLLSIIIIFFIYLSFINYLLFHSIIELISILIAFNIFVIAINTMEISENYYLAFLGIAYAFVGGFDLIHTLAYKGMGVFINYDSNLPTQLWIIARYFESISLLISFYFLKRSFNKNKIILIYFLFSLIFLLTLFYLPIFPDCYVEGSGLTLFKKVSEYIISTILLLGIIFLMKNKKYFKKNLYCFMYFALITTILSEISFTFYVSVYGLSNMLGHIFKLISFYFIYKAINETSLKKPYTLLFNKLRETNLKLKKEKEKLNRYFEMAELMVITIDDKGKIIELNQKSCEVLGYKKEELVGKDWTIFFDENEINKLKNSFSLLPANKSSLVHYGENELINKDGEKRKILWNSYVLKDKEGKIKRILSSGKDITDYKFLKEELEYNKLRLEFFANLSHELKTPLNLILSALQLLDQNLKKGYDFGVYQKCNRYTNIIKQNSYRLLKLTNNLLDISKIKTDFYDSNFKNLDIVKIIKETIDTAREYIEEKGRILKFNSYKEKKVIACDYESIERIILNLLSNAVKYTEKGDIISVNIFEEDEFLIISIKDTGLGIPEEQQGAIFEPFIKVDKSFARYCEGCGIGLAIVKLLVELHNGEIKVISVYREFTEFKVKLPIKMVNPEKEYNDLPRVDDLINKIEVEFSDIYD